MTVVAFDDYADFRAAADGNDASMASPADSSSWWPVDLDPIVAGILAGEIVGPVPSLLRRSDGVPLLYPGEIHSLAGEPETGKGWIALAATAQVLADGGHVLYIDCEDAPASIVTRLLALQVAPDDITAGFIYLRPNDPLIAAGLDTLLTAHTCQLAVIDGLSEAYALLGLDPHSNSDAATFLTALPRPIAAGGAAVLLIDHVIKNKEGRGRYALGAQHKLAGIAAAYTTDAITPPSRSTAGLIKLEIQKDRHGHVRSHLDGTTIAMVHIEPADNGNTVTVELQPPGVSRTASGEHRPTTLMGYVWNHVNANPGCTQNHIVAAVKSKRHEDKIQAIRVLLLEGALRTEDGPRNSRFHYTANTPELTDPGPVPTDPGTSPPPVPDWSPLKGGQDRDHSQTNNDRSRDTV